MSIFLFLRFYYILLEVHCQKSLEILNIFHRSLVIIHVLLCRMLVLTQVTAGFAFEAGWRLVKEEE